MNLVNDRLHEEKIRGRVISVDFFRDQHKSNGYRVIATVGMRRYGNRALLVKSPFIPGTIGSGPSHTTIEDWPFDSEADNKLVIMRDEQGYVDRVAKRLLRKASVCIESGNLAEAEHLVLTAEQLSLFGKDVTDAVEKQPRTKTPAKPSKPRKFDPYAPEVYDQHHFDPNVLDKIDSFAARAKYCNQHPKLKRLGSGSSRIVFDMLNTELVLKLAKNPKGVAQNNAEYDGYLQNSPVVTKIKAASDNELWLVSEKADKCTAKKFKAATGMNFETYARCLIYLNKYTGKPVYGVSPEEQKAVEDNEFFQEVDEIVRSMDMPTGDLARLSTYGILRGKVVIVDSGLSQEVSEQHYQR